MLTGELLASSAGHQYQIQFQDQRVRIEIASWSSLWALRRQQIPMTTQLARLLTAGDVTVKLATSAGREVELYPAPPWYLKLFSPQLRKMTS